MGSGDGEHGTALRPRSVRADAAEAQLLARFTAHPVFTGIEQVGQDAFLEILLQRRFLSLMFPVMYDVGIDGLMDPTAIKVVREILREEYPDPSGETPSHREDLVADLMTLGATRAQILGARPTVVTQAVIEGSFALLAEATQRDTDLELMTIIRFWGEVLVSVEYGEFWRRMEGAVRRRGHRLALLPPPPPPRRPRPAGHRRRGRGHALRPPRRLPRAPARRRGRRAALRRDRGARARAAPRLLRPVLITARELASGP